MKKARAIRKEETKTTGGTDGRSQLEYVPEQQVDKSVAAGGGGQRTPGSDIFQVPKTGNKLSITWFSTENCKTWLC